MPVVTANQLSFHVQLLGDPGAPPLAMLHGLFIGSLAGWYFTAAPALARRHRVLVYDLRGHGRSERARSGYDTVTMADDLDALLGSTRPVTLVGHSYGALVALRFALSRPGQVARLVLVEPPLPPSRAGEIASFVRLPPEEMARALPEPLRAQLGGRAGRLLVERLAFLAGETTVLEDLAREADPSSEELDGLACPTLVVNGTASSLRDAGERLARALPDGAHLLLPGGHYLPSESPDALTLILEGFCDG